MARFLPHFLRIGKFLLLASIAFLIIRKNTYPWPVKRASDLLFLGSFIATAAWVFFAQTWRMLRVRLAPLVTPCALILGGLLVGMTLYTPRAGEDVLALGRYFEVFFYLVLIGIFTARDPAFAGNALRAQLSTVLYLPVLIVPFLQDSGMYRFQLFENWPSNVGMYVLISLSILLAYLLKTPHPPLRSFAVAFMLAIGLLGILLWTQTRSAWMGFLASAVLILFVDAVRHYRFSIISVSRRYSAIALCALGALGIAFAILPRFAQNNILARVFPTLTNIISYTETPSLETIRVITGANAETRHKPSFSDNHRLRLWSLYGERVLGNPLGEGPNYAPVDIGAGKQGPHNTILEILVSGGILALVGVSLLIVRAFMNLLRVLRSHPYDYGSLAITGGLSGLLVASFFDNMVTFRLLWVILGLALFWKPSPAPSTSPSESAQAAPSG